MNPEPVPPPESPTPPRNVRMAAVVDIGATAIHMEIAEIDDQGGVRKLDSLSQGVQLGKDTFTRGRIQQTTIQECVDILKGFRRVMEEYGITQPEQIRAVATSSVREAQNRDTFLDRIYITTRINVRAIDEAEENRLTFMAAQTVLADEPELKTGSLLVADVGGGSTELILLQEGHIAFSDSYRLGSLRMRETLETHRAPTERVRTILGQHIQRLVEQVVRNLPVSTVPVLVAMSGDAHFAAAQLCPDWSERKTARLDYKTLAGFTDKLLPMTVAKIVGKYQLTYQEAETVGPALLVYQHLARAFKAEHILVPKASFRDGLLKEMTLHGYWTGSFAEQVRHSAIALADKYNVDAAHAAHVADLSVRLFRELQPEHQLDHRYELLLEVAARLHEMGGFISSRSHHKHSLYVILHSDLFGLTREEQTIVALVARYHRRALPAATHPEYMALNRDDRITVSKMAALIRVADALERNHLQQVRDLDFSREPGQFVITVHNVEDLTLERLALKEKGALFEEVYGMPVVLKEERFADPEARDGA
ncbi:MAG: exopolyphosphatase [Verrucomicrobia bacterium]|nr:exopolyphosphatase [Verrucomicrobiota bacterium]MBU1910015.1 exopolyphosphatase [Verrucomicrobiota bacterium]